jgi:hypothetical protein
MKTAIAALLLLSLCGCEKPPQRALLADCQQLIRKGLNDYQSKRQSADEVLLSLDRLCGPDGSLEWRPKP